MKELLIILLIITVIGCKQSNEELITGKWKGDEIILEFIDNSQVILHTVDSSNKSTYKFLDENRILIDGKIIVSTFKISLSDSTLYLTDEKSGKTTLLRRIDDVGIALNEIKNKQEVNDFYDALVADCINLGAMAQQYYRKPTAMGGGGGTFKQWSIPSNLVITKNGMYSAEISNDGLNVTITGKKSNPSGRILKVKAKITPQDIDTEIVE